MKNINKLFGIIVLFAVIGFSFADCGGDGGNGITGSGDPCADGHSFTAWADCSTVVWGMETRACSICSIKANDGSLRLANSNMVQLSGGTLYSTVSELNGRTIASFRMSRYQITQGQWAAVMAETSNNNYPSYFSSSPESGETQAQRPVESITWFDALEFANTLSELAGLTPVYTLTGVTREDNGSITSATVPVAENLSNSGYRMPTEAQWEYAARSGSIEQYSINSFGDEVTATGLITDRSHLYNHAWYFEYSNDRTHQVGLKTANEWGLHDMHGNVLEWTSTVSGSERVIRGGSYSDLTSGLVSSFKGTFDPGVGGYTIGFRLASL